MLFSDIEKQTKGQPKTLCTHEKAFVPAKKSRDGRKHPVELGGNAMFMDKSSSGAENLNAKKEETKAAAH